MRILWVSHSASPGGAEFALVEGVQALRARGHQLHVVLPGAGPLADRLESEATVHVCKHKPWMTFERRRPTLGKWLAYNTLVAAPRIARVAQHAGADVVLSNTMTTMAGAIAAKFARLPHVWFVHEFGREDHGLPFALGEPLTFLVMRRSMRVCIANSEAVRSHLQRRLPGVGVHVARYAVDVPDAGPGDEGGAQLRLVLMGTKKPSKGQHEAIVAVASLAASGLNVCLDLVGKDEGHYEQQLRDMATELGLTDQVRFAPFHPDPAALLHNADVVLMCSRAEALGRVTVEAMKAGKPVVGAASGATTELVRHGSNGFLYRPGDASDLAKWLDRCYHDRDGLRQMGEQGRSWARETFNQDRYGEALDAALRAAVPTLRRHRPIAAS